MKNFLRILNDPAEKLVAQMEEDLSKDPELERKLRFSLLSLKFALLLTGILIGFAIILPHCLLAAFLIIQSVSEGTFDWLSLAGLSCSIGIIIFGTIAWSWFYKLSTKIRGINL